MPPVAKKAPAAKPATKPQGRLDPEELQSALAVNIRRPLAPVMLGHRVAVAPTACQSMSTPQQQERQQHIELNVVLLEMQAGLAGLKRTARGQKPTKPRTPVGTKKAAFAPNSVELVKLRSREFAPSIQLKSILRFSVRPIHVLAFAVVASVD